jgi:eukaryotic-like serine/threonine-protein kinase
VVHGIRSGWGQQPVKKPTAFGKYFLLERINVGGMAEVFRAKAFGVEGFERLVAVKRILPNIAEDKEFIRMFIEEAKLSVQLNHANIAQIFDLGVVDGSYYIALEHVHGRDLRGIFDRCRQLGEVMPVAQACFVAMKVCEGLDYAHNKRDQAGRELSLVHRDVSPQNVLVSFEGEVKLIDFGIAKAAGTGAKTQAGILKGKFGYMSPEQVRGLQVDRRSDVFSCGIVLYELLTGERLFVGESDFSTLEKVRNVEILPPSTYNRKIPDELERIVLKALTKDVDDRYQNAIDLHDELQAFVYTAGEFYSRKDLAGWMKKIFGKEIEDETAKLESYRQLKPPVLPIAAGPGAAVAPPPVPPPTPPASAPAPIAGAPAAPLAVASSAPAAPSSVVAALPLPAEAPPAPPVPTAIPDPGPAVPRTVSTSKSVPVRKPTQPVPIAKPPPPPVHRSQPVPVVAQPPAASGPVPVRKGGHGHLNAAHLGWDDDDIETRIYDEDEQKRRAAKRSNLPLQPPVSSSPGISLAAADRAQAGELASIASDGAWDGSGRAPAQFPAGSSNAPSPLLSGDSAPVPRGRERSAGHRIASGAPSGAASVAPSGAASVGRVTLDPMASFGARITGGRRPIDRRPIDRRRALTIALAGATVTAIAVIAVLLLSGNDAGPTSQPARAPSPARATAHSAADPNTGFDLYVTPPGMTKWKLDGEARTDRLPSRIRGIAAGTHTVQIEPPPGFLSQFQQVTVEPGTAPKVEIVLQPIPGIVGVFESTPPGATVSLIVDGKRRPIGASPARSPLDPRSAYQVLFEKPGYVSVNRPITFSGGVEEHVSVHLEKTDVPAPPPAPSGAAPRAPARPVRTPDKAPERSTTAPVAPVDAPARADAPPAEPRSPSDTRGHGFLVLGSKPPCEIAVDGSPTGLHTPQKELKLPVGRHRITLTNTEFGIKETFTVDIKADAPEKVIKDYSDKLPNQ